MVNTTTVSLPTDQPSSLVSTASTPDSGNPIVSALQPLQSAMCGQLKSSHPSGCSSYGVFLRAITLRHRGTQAHPLSQGYRSQEDHLSPAISQQQTCQTTVR